VHSKILSRLLLLLILLVGHLSPAGSVHAEITLDKPAQLSDVTAFDLIIAMNTLRMSLGLPALIEDPIINAVAQYTAESMAASQMSWHIGNVSGRIQSAGYGGGSKVWATENFAVGNQSIDEIMVVWSDASHMIPAVNPAYCHIGAGVAKSSNGLTYYVLQAAYTAGKSCGAYTPPEGFTPQPGVTPGKGTTGGASQIIVPVKIATPDADGKIFHLVQAGQSFWSIAVSYKITIKDIETWNNISKESKLQIGQRLFIPSSNTAGYVTPTPVGMIQISLPDADGRVVHSVQPYQTLSTIAQAYKVSVLTLLNLNGIQEDWPLQIGQTLVVNSGSFTPSPTMRPLTPLEKLTPESDGLYYHIIRSGETLSWIAQLYEVQVADLMAWNGLNAASILYPQQKLLLRVTPPATQTPTPGPPTLTPIPTDTMVPRSATVLQTPTPAAAQVTVSAAVSVTVPGPGLVWPLLIGLGLGGLFLVVFFARKK
jgi:LysM repeat protein